MKRLLTIALAVCFLFVGVAAAWAAQPVIFIDGEELVSDTSAVIEGDRTLLPMRAVFEALDQKVDWDNETKTITAGDIVLQVDNCEATVAGEVYELDVPPTLIESRTYVPLRFVAESLDKTVDWDEDAKRVDITFEEELVEEEATEEEAAEEEVIEEDTDVEEDADVDEDAAEEDPEADGDGDEDADAEDENDNGDAEETEEE